MGVHDSAHSGQLLAAQRKTASTTDRQQCSFCGATLPDNEGSERVEHVLPADGGTDTRTAVYCSPGCFVRQMDDLSGIE